MPASRPKNPAGQRAAASCSVPFEFSAPRLLHCAVPAPWGARKLYNCSATREPPLEHRLSRGRSSTSSGLSVHLMGDSLMYQLLHVARCAVTDPLVRFKSAALHVIPPEPLLTELLTPVLKKGASRMHGAGGEALFVVSFGTWYNWEPSATALPDNVPANWTERRLWRCAPVLPFHSKQVPFHPMQYSLARRKCVDGLGLHAFMSDMKRLVLALKTLVARHAIPRHALVWRSIPAQHYPTPGGLYSTAVAAGWPALKSGLRCVPLAAGGAYAYSRNAAANRVLVELGAPFAMMSMQS